MSGKPSAPPLFAIDAARAVGRLLSDLARRTAPAPIPLLEIVAGHWRVHALGAVARLGLADRLAGGPRDVGDLAQEVGADEDALFRLLRALASDGILDRTAPRSFALNAISQPLRTDHPMSMHHTTVQITSEWSMRSWSHLADAVRDGKPTFEQIYGEVLWAWFDAHPDEGLHFHRSMAELSRLDVAPIAAGYDFGRHTRVVDLGGGEGELLAGLLTAYPGLRGAVHDTEQGARGAPERLARAGVADRAEVLHGSFYESVPAGFDLYLMRQIVHGHDDSAMKPVLEKVHAAMPADAHLLVLDTLMPEEREAPNPAFLDLQMLIGSGGRERTRTQMARLLDAANFRLLDVIRTASLTAIFVAERR